LIHLRRFRWKRRRVALALLPAVVMMSMAHLAGASVPTPDAHQSATPAGSGGVTAINIGARRNVMANHLVTFQGSVIPGGSRQVGIEVGGDTLSVRTADDGGFKAAWRAPHPGEYRAVVSVVGADAGAPTAAVKVNAYRPASASYYGPGLYGGALACGGVLSPGKIGVANKTLPCGTHLTLRYRHRTVQVQVIDRGPYAGNREFDLTAATKAKLGFPSTGTVLTTR
jgi:rare lipoprotein A